MIAFPPAAKVWLSGGATNVQRHAKLVRRIASHETLPDACRYRAPIATRKRDGSGIPVEGSITRRNGERANTVQAFMQAGVLPEEALVEVQARIAEAGFVLPEGVRLQIGGDADAPASTLNNLIASLGLFVTLSIVMVVPTFGNFRLAGVAIVVSGLSAGLSMLALAVFAYRSASMPSSD